MIRKTAFRSEFNRMLNFWAFVLPSVLIFTLFYMVPLFGSVLYSFTDWDGVQKVVNFVGLSNYITAFTDQAFLNSLKVTLQIGVIYVASVNIIAFLLALLLDSELIRGRYVYRSVVFVPNTVSLIVVAFIWTFMFNNVYNPLMQALGLDSLRVFWFSSGGTATVAVVIAYLWQSVGYYMMIYLAGLQTIDRSMLEAANIDGAGYLSRLWHVIIPMMMPSFTVNLFLTIANSFKKFEIVFQMTGGGPGKTTQTIALDIYYEAYRASKLGYASAKAIVLCLIIVLLTSLQLRALKKREVEL